MENVKRSNIQVGSKKVTLELYLEENGNSIYNFTELKELSEEFVTYFTDEKQTELETEIARELTDPTYWQNKNKEVSEQNYAKKQADLRISCIVVFEEGFSVEYMSENQYPGYKIVAQLAADYSIEDIILTK